MKQIYLIFTITFLSITVSRGQEDPILDSLKVLLQEAELEDKYFVYAKIINYSKTSQEVEKYADKAIKLAVSNSKFDMKVRVMTWKSLRLIDVGSYEKGMAYLDETINYAKSVGEHYRLALAMKHKAYKVMQSGNMEEALTISKSAVAIGDSIGSPKLNGSLYDNLGSIYRNMNDFDKAEVHFLKSIAFSEEAGNDDVALEAKFNLASMFEQVDDLKAIEKYLEINTALQNSDDYSFKALVKDALAASYHRTFQFTKAIEYAYAGLEIAEKRNSYRDATHAHYTLSEIYADINDYKNVMYHADKEKELAIKLNEPGYITTAITVPMRILTEQRRFDESRKLYEEGLQYVKDGYWYSVLLREYSKLLIAEGSYEQAIEYLQIAKDNYQSKDPYINGYLDAHFGEAYYHLGQGKKAVPYLLSAHKLSQENDMISIEQSTSHLLYQNFKDKKPELALRYLERYTILQDSMLSNDNIRKAESMKLNKVFDEEKVILALQQKELEYLASRNKIIAISIGSLAFLIFGFLLNFRRKNKLISEQKNQLEASNAVKDQLFTIIGHDLRKPCIAFRGISKNIDYLIENNDIDRLKRLGKEIDGDAQQLFLLTDNLLNWAVTQKNLINLHPEKVNLHNTVQEAMAVFSSAARRKEISIHNNIDLDTTLTVDKNTLLTIIRNLVDNAIKYTETNGLINISAKSVNDRMHIVVQDNGLGFSTEKMKLISSDKHVKSQQGTKAEKGSGIGLMVVKSLTEKIEGNIEIENGIEKGAIVTINLPHAV